MREPHRGVQEWLSRRPSESPPFAGQRLTPAAGSRRLQPGQLLPSAVAAALAFGTDRNSARPTLQNRRPHSSDGSLHSHSPRHRLAASRSVSQRGAGFQPRLTLVRVLESIFVRSAGGALLEKQARVTLPAIALPQMLYEPPHHSQPQKTALKNRKLQLS